MNAWTGSHGVEHVAVLVGGAARRSASLGGSRVVVGRRLGAASTTPGTRPTSSPGDAGSRSSGTAPRRRRGTRRRDARRVSVHCSDTDDLFLWCGMRVVCRDGRRAALSQPKTRADEPGEAEVEQGHRRHHHRDEHDDDDRVVAQLGPRRPDDLAQLVEDLADEETHRAEEPGDRVAAPLLALGGAERSPGLAHVRHDASSVELFVGCLRAARPRRQRRGERLQSWTNHTATQGRRDSNPQPPVLETGALPIEPLPYGDPGGVGSARCDRRPAVPWHAEGWWSHRRASIRDPPGPARTRRPPPGGPREPLTRYGSEPRDRRDRRPHPPRPALRRRARGLPGEAAHGIRRAQGAGSAARPDARQAAHGPARPVRRAARPAGRGQGRGRCGRPQLRRARGLRELREMFAELLWVEPEQVVAGGTPA